jgi:small conductance mechanosensitive channel
MEIAGVGNRDLSDVLRNLDKINFLDIVIVIVLAFLAYRVIKKVLPWIADRLPGRFRFYILPLVPVLRVVITVVAFALIVPMVIQPSFENILVILGTVGLGLGFALKDYVSSLAAGLVAVYERPYRPGDWVQIGNVYGEVQAVESRALRLVTLDDTFVTIPNKKLWDNSILNANNANRELMCIADFHLRPDHNAERVWQKLHDVALTSPYLQIERPIVVAVAEKPWGTHYRVKAYPIDSRDQIQFITDLTVRGKAALAKIGCEAAMTAPAVSIDFESSASTSRDAPRQQPDVSE